MRRHLYQVGDVVELMAKEEGPPVVVTIDGTGCFKGTLVYSESNRGLYIAEDRILKLLYRSGS